MERDRLTYSPRHRQRHCADQDNYFDMSDFSSVPIPVGERPSLTSMDILNIVPSEVSAGSEAASTSSVCASPGPDTSYSEKQTRAMRATSQMGLDGARMEQENVILARYTAELNKDNVAEAMCSSRLPHLILALSGVLPCGAGKLPGHYKRFVCSACFFTGAYSLYTLLSQGVNILSTFCVCYSLGGGVGLFSLQRMNIHNLIGKSDNLLDNYARRHGFLGMWAAASLRLLVFIGAFWTGAVVMTGVMVAVFWSTIESPGITIALTLGYIFASGVVVVLTYCQLHVCAGLELMVDSFCVEFLAESNFREGVAQWNTIQAIMRRASHTIDLCFVSVQTSVLTASVLLGMDVMLGSGSLEHAFRGLPSCGLLMAIMQFGQYKAAVVTQKCQRMPAVVNSLAIEGQAINCERQYMVQFIMQSAAGFYVRGVRLTPFMVFKAAYLCVMIMIGFAMRFSKADSNP